MARGRGARYAEVMSRLLQRWQRRAIVALAWLVLALSVAPAAAESLRPVAVCAAVASSVPGPAGTRASLRAGAPAARRVAPSGTRRAAPAETALAVAPARAAIRRVTVAPALEAAALAADCRPARDERRRYLTLCRLSC